LLLADVLAVAGRHLGLEGLELRLEIRVLVAEGVDRGLPDRLVGLAGPAATPDNP
jgi:hypothetical protein